ncbi:MAG: hypothetical protein ACOC0D_10430 [Spirochaeta sp.]
MDPRTLRKRILQLIGMLLTAILGSLALMLLTPEPEENPRMGWDHVYPVLVQRDRLPVPPEQLMLREADETVISARSSLVSFTVFGSMEEIPVAALDDRLMEEDPRYDPYLRSVQRFFHAPSHPNWEIVYYSPVNQSEQQVNRHLTELENTHPDGILYTSNRQLPVWVHLMIFGMGAVIAAWGIARAGRQWFWVMLASVPLLVTAPAGNPVVFCALATAFLIWLRIFARVINRLRSVLHHPDMVMWDRPRRRMLTAGLLLLVLLPLGIGFYSREWILFFVVLLGLLVKTGVSVLAWNWVHLQEYRRDHRLFVPLSLLPKRASGYALLDSAPFILVLAAGIIFSAVLGDGTNGRPGWQALKLPQPVEEYDAGSIDELIAQTGDLQEDSERLPHLGDFLSHRAYQEGYAYGRSYGYPTIDEEVRLYAAVRDGQRFVAHEETRIRFTQEWFSDTVQRGGPDNIENLLRRQGVGRMYHVDTVESVFFDVRAIAWTMLLTGLALLIGIPLPRMRFSFRIPRAVVAKSGAAA